MDTQLNDYREAQRRKYEAAVDSQGNVPTPDVQAGGTRIESSQQPSQPSSDLHTPSSNLYPTISAPPPPTQAVYTRLQPQVQAQPQRNIVQQLNADKQRQLDEDAEFARNIQQQEYASTQPSAPPAYPHLDDNQIADDEQLARLLQEEGAQSPEVHHPPSQTQTEDQAQPQPAQEEGGGFFASLGRGLRNAYNAFQEYSAQQANRIQLNQDEALARQLQAEEGGMSHPVFRVHSPSVGRRANFPNFYNYDEDYDESDMFDQPHIPSANPLSRLREANSVFRSIGAPPEHPLFQHLHDLMQHTQDYNHTGGAPQIFFRMPVQRYRYPGNMFQQVRGVENLPPELYQMMQGEADTSYESLLQLADRLEPVSRGASNEQIEQLPTRKYTEGSMPAEEAKCGVCLADYEKDEELRTLPGCFHSFHKECIDKWLQINKICPVCRHEITETS